MATNRFFKIFKLATIENFGKFWKKFCVANLTTFCKLLEKISENLKKTFLLPFWQHFDERLKILEKFGLGREVCWREVFCCQGEIFCLEGGFPEGISSGGCGGIVRGGGLKTRVILQKNYAVKYALFHLDQITVYFTS